MPTEYDLPASSRFRVDAPPYAPSPYGLLDAASQPVNSDPHLFQNGVWWDPACYGPAGLTKGGCEDVDPGDPAVVYDKTGATSGFGGVAVATRFVVYTVFECATAGRTLDEQRARATEQLLRGEARTIEAVVERGGPTADGSIPGDPWAGALAVTAVEASPDPNPIAVTIGILEAKLGWSYGGAGVLHMTRREATLAQNAQLLVEDRGRLRTVLGTLVAAGTGYLGTGPGGASSALPTIYATGPVIAYRGPVTITGDDSSGVIRDTNTRQIVAEREVVVGWECAAWSAAVDLAAYDVPPIGD